MSDLEGRTRTVFIQDTEYKITVLPPSRSIKLLAKLTKLVGVPMAKVAGASGEGKTKEDFIPLAVEALVQNLDGDQLLAMLQEMMACVFKDGKSLQFEREFHGYLGKLVKLSKEVLEVNFSDFLEEISELMSSQD